MNYFYKSFLIEAQWHNTDTGKYPSITTSWLSVFLMFGGHFPERFHHSGHWGFLIILFRCMASIWERDQYQTYIYIDCIAWFLSKYVSTIWFGNCLLHPSTSVRWDNAQELLSRKNRIVPRLLHACIHCILYMMCIYDLIARYICWPL